MFGNKLKDMIFGTSRRQGMLLMDDFLIDLWRSGRITKEVALEHAFDKKAMGARLGGSGEP